MSNVNLLQRFIVIVFIAGCFACFEILEGAEDKNGESAGEVMKMILDYGEQLAGGKLTELRYTGLDTDEIIRSEPEARTDVETESRRVSHTSSLSADSPTDDSVTLFEGIYREGRFVVRQTWSGDFDKGREVPRGADPGEADVWFQARTEIDRVVVPRNNARLSLMLQFIEPSFSQVKQILDDGGVEEINVNHLLPGLWVAVKTNEGAYAAFTLEEAVGESPGVLHILYRYWAEIEAEIEEDCLAFDPAQVTLEADNALEVIKYYGFEMTCYVGRPGPSMTYFRK